jgi:SAM-dependent methyltransferase
MDQQTIDIYDKDPGAYSSEWHAQTAPSDLHDMVGRHFCPGPTADIGCGAGRDTAWLASQGFDAVGYDASAGLLAQARLLYPGIKFVEAALPELEGVEDGSFENVLCETVIMHIPVRDIPGSVKRLMAILRPSGTLYLTWRVTEGTDRRSEDGRLYSAFPPSLVRDALDAATILFDGEDTSRSSGRTLHRMVVRSPGKSP